MKTTDRLEYAKKRIAKLTAKMEAHNALVKHLAVNKSASIADFDRAMKARRSTIATRKRWLKVVAEYEVKNAVC